MTSAGKEPRLKRTRLWRSGIALLLLGLALGTGWALGGFFSDADIAVLQRAVSLGAAGIFFVGCWPLMLGKVFSQRLIGLHLMAAASALLLIALGPWPSGWLLGAAGWTTCLAVHLWGRVLFRGMSKQVPAEGEKGPR
jgi:hypothetical protein